MKTVQGQVLESLHSCKSFLDTNDERLAGVAQSGAGQKLIRTIVDLESHVAGQTGNQLASQIATRTQRALREALLRDHMRPIACIAKAELTETPELESLRMPAGKPTVERLAALAHGMGQAALPFAPLFAAHGLPGDFVVRLERAADAMVAALVDRRAHRGRRVGDTKGLKEKLSRGRKLVHVLDAMIQSALRDEPALLAHWNSVKRVQRMTGRAAAVQKSEAAAQAPSRAVLPGGIERARLRILGLVTFRAPLSAERAAGPVRVVERVARPVEGDRDQVHCGDVDVADREYPSRRAQS